MTLDETIRLAVLESVEQAIRPLADRLAAIERRLGAASPAEVYVTPKRAGEIAGVKPATIRAWVRDKKLKAHGEGRLRIKVGELQSLIEQKPVELTREHIEASAAEAARKLGVV